VEPRMVSDRQVRLLRKKRMEDRTMEAAASAAGMSKRTARKWQRGPLPSATKEPRTWRTRPDPFEKVWSTEIEPLLVADKEGKLEAKTIFAALCRKRPGVFEPGQVRTLQRRVREWRAERGPDKEVYFPQKHVPGRMASMDFTHATELGVTIAGVLFVHMFFEFVLAYSGWRFVQLAFGETFEALVKGLQTGDRSDRDAMRLATGLLLPTAVGGARWRGRGLRRTSLRPTRGLAALRVPGRRARGGFVQRTWVLSPTPPCPPARSVRIGGDGDEPGFDDVNAACIERLADQGRGEKVWMDALAAFDPVVLRAVV
jgi:hypothetical protein